MKVKELIRTPVAVLFLGFAAGSIYLSIVAEAFSFSFRKLRKISIRLFSGGHCHW